MKTQLLAYTVSNFLGLLLLLFSNQRGYLERDMEFAVIMLLFVYSIMITLVILGYFKRKNHEKNK